MKYRRITDKLINEASPAGERIKNDYRVITAPEGYDYLEKIGEIDIQEEINSYLEESMLSTKIERFSKGDTTALNEKTPAYQDLADIPTNINEVNKAIKTNKKIKEVIENARMSKRPNNDSRSNNNSNTTNIHDNQKQEKEGGEIIHEQK